MLKSEDRRGRCPRAKIGTFKLAYSGGRWAYQMRHGVKMEQKGPGFKRRPALSSYRLQQRILCHPGGPGFR